LIRLSIQNVCGFQKLKTATKVIWLEKGRIKMI